MHLLLSDTLGANFTVRNERTVAWAHSQRWWDTTPSRARGSLDLVSDAVSEPELTPWLARLLALPPNADPSAVAAHSHLADDLTAYIRFHRSVVGGNGGGQLQPRYLALVCDGSDGSHCSGIGDRFSATITSLVLGMMTQRVLLISHSWPAPLTRYLVPRLVAWDAAPTLLDPSTPVYPLYMQHGPPHGPPTWWAPNATRWVHESSLGFRRFPPAHMLSLNGDDDPLAVIWTNTWPRFLQHADTPSPASPWLDAPHLDMETHPVALHRILGNVLFQVEPAFDALVSRTAALLWSRNGSAAPPRHTIGIHLRLGDAAFHGRDVSTERIARELDAVVRAARALEAANGFDPAATGWLFLSDTAAAMSVAAARIDPGKLYLVDSPDPVHIELGPTGNAKARAMDTAMTELLLLSRCHCIVGPASGFSRAAAALQPVGTPLCFRALARDYESGN